MQCRLDVSACGKLGDLIGRRNIVVIPGIAVLVVALCGILLALNFGSTIGWSNPAIIAGFVIGIIALIVLVKIEEKANEPLIPLKLFKNTQYTVLAALPMVKIQLRQPYSVLHMI